MSSPTALTAALSAEVPAAAASPIASWAVNTGDWSNFFIGGTRHSTKHSRVFRAIFTSLPKLVCALQTGTPSSRANIEEIAAWVQTHCFDGVSTDEDGPALRARARALNRAVAELCRDLRFSEWPPASLAVACSCNPRG